MITDTKKIEYKEYSSKDQKEPERMLICTPCKGGNRMKIYRKGKLVADKFVPKNMEEMDVYLNEHVYCSFINMLDKEEFPRKHECPRRTVLLSGYRYRSLK